MFWSHSDPRAARGSLVRRLAWLGVVLLLVAALLLVAS